MFQVEPSEYDTWILFEYFWFILWDGDSLNSLFPLTTFSLKIDFNKVTLPRPWGSQLLLRREKNDAQLGSDPLEGKVSFAVYLGAILGAVIVCTSSFLPSICLNNLSKIICPKEAQKQKTGES